MQLTLNKLLLVVLVVISVSANVAAQDSQLQTQLKVKQLVEKKAEYHRLTGGEQDGYRIKIHFGVDRDKAKAVHSKFSSRFSEYRITEDYQQPYWVVLVGDFKTKLEAFEAWKKIKPDFADAFIAKGRIRAK